MRWRAVRRWRSCSAERLREGSAEGRGRVRGPLRRMPPLRRRSARSPALAGDSDLRPPAPPGEWLSCSGLFLLRGDGEVACRLWWLWVCGGRSAASHGEMARKDDAVVRGAVDGEVRETEEEEEGRAEESGGERRSAERPRRRKGLRALSDAVREEERERRCGRRRLEELVREVVATGSTPPGTVTASALRLRRLRRWIAASTVGACACALGGMGACTLDRVC
jgi:hypothetical protein